MGAVAHGSHGGGQGGGQAGAGLGKHQLQQPHPDALTATSKSAKTSDILFISVSPYR
jgi:hypothetical protein